VKVYAGSFAEALIKARSKARLLVVFIPSSKPKKEPNDVKAIQSIFSSEVSQVAERPARKKQQEGSFSFWSTKFDSNEATTAMKRLKTASKVTSGKGKGKNPVLMVIYPSATMTSSGVKIVPRVLAQHHCNPPPDAESMAMWLNALRKRHAKQYVNMQHELKEMELFKERQKGFQSSLKDDRKREEEEKLKEKQAAEEEKARKEREEEVKLRRIGILEALPEEPETGSDGVVTIALRFSDGRKGQRRFESDSLIDDVFNWIDAIFKTERETVELMTMTGTKKFSFGDDSSLTLDGAGLGKMAALRVIEKQVEGGDGDNEASEDEDSEG
jgi:Skp family chaperone for outer membrane proteins